MHRVQSFRWQRLDIPMREPFGIAGGAQLVANNGLVIVTLADGTQGVGEAAPFPAVNAKTQAAVEANLLGALPNLEGLEFSDWQTLPKSVPAFDTTPTARTALELALVDAALRSEGRSLWEVCGKQELELETDITVGTGDIESARQASLRAAGDGFRCLKIKVGSKLDDPRAALELDRARILAVGESAPEASLILDGNAAYDSIHAVELVESLGDLRRRVALFEQPTAKHDIRGLLEVQQRAQVAVAADESCQGPESLAELRGVAVINVKLMKSGVLGAVRLIEEAKARGFGLMMGGMVESRLAMGAAASIAAGFGGFSFIDLDTPLWLAEDPCCEGYTQVGPSIRLAPDAKGHGARVAPAWLNEPA
ncbi:MAG: dipeptide epimerase [Myxococcales bacterium]|nr:dipeptide epimerase [Myxococcales bacterium]